MSALAGPEGREGHAGEARAGDARARAEALLVREERGHERHRLPDLACGAGGEPLRAMVEETMSPN